MALVYTTEEGGIVTPVSVREFIHLLTRPRPNKMDMVRGRPSLDGVCVMGLELFGRSLVYDFHIAYYNRRDHTKYNPWRWTCAAQREAPAQ